VYFREKKCSKRHFVAVQDSLDLKIPIQIVHGSIGKMACAVYCRNEFC